MDISTKVTVICQLWINESILFLSKILWGDGMMIEVMIGMILGRWSFEQLMIHTTRTKVGWF